MISQTAESHVGSGVMVDDQGVMRWKETGVEVKSFGVNYTVPFAHAYRSAKKMGRDPLAEIDRDVYHLSRLGFDLFRVHVWDTEISDTDGNLIDNEHLQAYDYLLFQLGQRGFRYVLTPIAFWGNGWPDPDENTPGFSHKFGKDNCLTNPEAIQAQETYLFQFMNHVNPYTGVAYRNDPRVLAVEISNEPHHREPPDQVTAFVKKMVASVKKSGFAGPIFYNISHSVHLVDDYFAAGIDGGTFQWYPTGLGYQRELPGNALPAVSQYLIPFDDRIKAHQGAKLVYEFDAADIGRSYIYPAIARSFRTAGIQLATHFSYDPLFLAPVNTEYNTHFMNLAYTPQKALSLMISAEVFRQIPMYEDFGSYPANNQFGNFTVDYDADLALLNDGVRYYYTNNVDTPPREVSTLKHIAGCGSSPLVSYTGTGAYFLDKLEPGVWRLEVMPDALIVDNPYGHNRADKTVAVVQSNRRKLGIQLSELGANYRLEPLNAGNKHRDSASDGTVEVFPGTYLLVADGVVTTQSPADGFLNMKLGEFEAPADNVNQTYLVHEPAESVVAGYDLPLTVQVASPDKSPRVRLFVTSTDRPLPVKMNQEDGFTFSGVIPGSSISKGELKYYLEVENEGKTQMFPGRNAYAVQVFETAEPITLFDAERHHPYLISSRWIRGQGLVSLTDSGVSAYEFRTRGLFRKDPENLDAPKIQDYSIRYPFGDRARLDENSLANKTALKVTGRSATGKPQLAQIALVMKDGVAYGKQFTVGPEVDEIKIDLNDLKPVKTVILPRPYPTFLPYYFDPGPGRSEFKISEIESLQISVGPGVAPDQLDETHGLAIVSVTLD